MSSHYKAIGANIKKLRERKGLSQSHVAELSGINRSYYGRVERGEVNFTVGILFSIADALGIPAARLLERADA